MLWRKRDNNNYSHREPEKEENLVKLRIKGIEVPGTVVAVSDGPAVDGETVQIAVLFGVRMYIKLGISISGFRVQ